MEQVQNNDDLSYAILRENSVVATIRYKIYVVIMLIIIVIGRGYMQDAVSRSDQVQQSIHVLQQQKAAQDQAYQQTLQDLTVIKEMGQEKDTLVNCFTTSGCNSFPADLTGVRPQTRVFLQLQKDSATKMTFDEKQVLANIDQYLLRGVGGQSNGDVSSIIFGPLAPVIGNDDLLQLPITMTVTFADKNGLLSFVGNIENTISAQFPMMYTLTSINYDIVKYQQNQTVTIQLVGYMMK